MSESGNVWSDDWEWEASEDWFTGRATRLPRGEKLGATVYELDPGGGGAYHFHHGAEELLIVLRGRPTVRTPDGERQLAEGDVVLFPVGPAGAHQTRNETDEPVRYVYVSNRVSPEVVEYPDTRQLTAMALTESQFGRPLWDIRTLEEPQE
ncbi:MAG TPA: cupin domain-containing protein [Gaiellaceae bacterium]|jgi:uncharacterized cupin superfamily protein|nr:cupin domain-containing protein [Gaiellaceae bacterium]